MTTDLPFGQIESWDPAHLQLVDWSASGGSVVVDPAGQVTWTGQVTVPTTLALTKLFQVEPCTWTQTTLLEELWVDGVEMEQRPVAINKLPSQLWIGAAYEPAVTSGLPATFTLIYSNTGGYENSAGIYNNFPPEAPFYNSAPPPDLLSPDRLFAQWYLGDVAQGEVGSIDVTVMISHSLPPSTTIEIWDYIGDHTLQVQDAVSITFHVESPLVWDKTVDGVGWTPGMTITRQTSDTIVVQEVLHLLQPPLLKAAVEPVFDPASPLPEPRADLTTRAGGGHTAAAPRSPEAVLWDQSTAQGSAGVSDYMTNLSLGAFSADDFQNDTAWSIDTIFVDGWDTGGDLLRASLLSWYIYADAGGAPAGYPSDGLDTALWSLSLPPNHPAVTIGLGSYQNVTLDVIQATGGSLNLPPGHYWLVFYPSLDSAPGLWYWRFATTSNLNHPATGRPGRLLWLWLHHLDRLDSRRPGLHRHGFPAGGDGRPAAGLCPGRDLGPDTPATGRLGSQRRQRDRPARPRGVDRRDPRPGDDDPDQVAPRRALHLDSRPRSWRSCGSTRSGWKSDRWSSTRCRLSCGSTPWAEVPPGRDSRSALP